MSSAAVPTKTFRASRKPFRARAKTVRLPPGITVRLQPGILFVFTQESFSRSPRNPFRLAPESAARSFAPPRACAEVWSTQLANQDRRDHSELVLDLRRACYGHKPIGRRRLFHMGDAVPQTPWDLPRSCHPM